MNSKKSYQTHIAKYLSNEMALAAKIWFYLKNQINPKTKHELNTLKVFFNSMKVNEKNKDIEFDTGKAWQKLQERIKTESYTGQSRTAFIPNLNYFAVAATLLVMVCLLYTSDAADALLCVDLGGRRPIKKTNTKTRV